MAGRNSQVSRIYMILNIMESAPHGLSVGDLCERLSERTFEVTKRTVYRDLEALQRAGFPLTEKGKNDDQGTRWTLDRTAKVGQYLALSPRELVALYLAKQTLTPLKDTPFYDDLKHIFNKIEEKLGTKSQEYLSELSDEFRVEPGPRWGLGIDPDILETVRTGCMERSVLKVTYDSKNSKTQRSRLLGPHYLYFAKGSLYLVAEDLESNTVKVFSLPRVTAAEMTSDSYSGVVTDPESFFAHSIGVFRGQKPEAITIDISSTLAAFVSERRWHPTQNVELKKDGSATMTLNVAVTPELIQWIMGFGAEAEVTAPKSLALRIQEEAQRMLNLYLTKKKSA